jgi:hypothetical protein
LFFIHLNWEVNPFLHTLSRLERLIGFSTYCSSFVPLPFS